jgi:hypothetical protein
VAKRQTVVQTDEEGRPLLSFYERSFENAADIDVFGAAGTC